MKKILLITTLAFLAMIGVTYAAFSCVTTTDATTVERDLCWSVNAVGTWGADDRYNATNGTVWVRSAGKTTQTDYVEIKNNVEDDATAEWTNGTGNNGGLTYNMSICFADLTGNIDIDADDIEVMIGMQNMSSDTVDTRNYVNCTAATSKNIDFGKPTCTLSGVTANTVYGVESTNTVTLTSTNGTDSAYLYVDTAGHIMTKGTIADAQTYTWTFNYPDGTYDITSSTYVTDGTNSTTCSAITGIVLQPKAGRGGTSGGATTGAAPIQGIQQPIQGIAIGNKLKGKIGPVPIWLIIIIGLYLLGRKQKWF